MRNEKPPKDDGDSQQFNQGFPIKLENKAANSYFLE
jgi:hypothetical protein